MRIREWIVTLGLAVTIGGLFLALTPGVALIAAGALLMLFGLFVMGGE